MFAKNVHLATSQNSRHVLSKACTEFMHCAGVTEHSYIKSLEAILYSILLTTGRPQSSLRVLLQRLSISWFMEVTGRSSCLLGPVMTEWARY